MSKAKGKLPREVEKKLDKDYEAVDDDFKESKGTFNLYIWGSDDTPTSIRGIYLGMKPGKTFPDGHTAVKFEIKIGEEVQEWNAPAILSDRLSIVPINAEVIIDHLGTISTPNGDAHNFRVRYKEPVEQKKLPF